MDWWICFHPDDNPGGESGEGEDAPDGGESQEGTPGLEGQEMVPKSEVAKANAEAAKYRRQLRSVEKRVEELEAAEKSELERSTDKVTKAETQLQEATRKNAELRVRILAEDVGIVRSARADAALLLDWNSISDPNDDTEVVAALEELVKERPYLLGTTSGADGGTGGRTPETTDMNKLIRSATGR